MYTYVHMDIVVSRGGSKPAEASNPSGGHCCQTYWAKHKPDESSSSEDENRMTKKENLTESSGCSLAMPELPAIWEFLLNECTAPADLDLGAASWRQFAGERGGKGGRGGGGGGMVELGGVQEREPGWLGWLGKGWRWRARDEEGESVGSHLHSGPSRTR
uniref:Uncharacterized protein n=1 Tax=Vespula pensylvanica TaxID=30213 RepID=A0A834P2W6_VESPE|nr:hypothetical protein H0235_008145 [Vespula pensylvanica]